MLRRGVFESRRFEGTHYLHLQGSTNVFTLASESSMFSRNVGIPPARDAASHPRRTRSSATSLRKKLKSRTITSYMKTGEDCCFRYQFIAHTHCRNITVREFCDGLLTTYWAILSILTPYYLTVDVISLVFALLRLWRCSFINPFGLNYNDVSGEVNSVSRQV
jgi:hypothetical protein